MKTTNSKHVLSAQKYKNKQHTHGEKDCIGHQKRERKKQPTTEANLKIQKKWTTKSHMIQDEQTFKEGVRPCCSRFPRGTCDSCAISTLLRAVCVFLGRRSFVARTVSHEVSSSEKDSLLRRTRNNRPAWGLLTVDAQELCMDLPKEQ